MIVYKIDSQPQRSASAQIRDMDKVLAEIPTSLQILQDLLTQQGAAISSPSIDNFRTELRRDLNDTIRLAQNIAQRSQKLATVSDQAAKHLSAIEEHFGAVLRTTQPAQTADAVR